MSEKLYYTIADLQDMFGCGLHKAESIMRSIKAYSDSMQMRGRVLVTDFEAWYNRPREKNIEEINRREKNEPRTYGVSPV